MGKIQNQVQIQTQTKIQAKQQLNELRVWLKKLKRVLNQMPRTWEIYEFQKDKEKYLDPLMLSKVIGLLYFMNNLTKRPDKITLSDLLGVLVDTTEAVEQSFDYLDELIDLYGE